MSTAFTPFASLVGGMMIGLAAVMLLATTGRIAGISGLAQSALPPLRGGVSAAVGAAFVLGLFAAPVVYMAATGSAPQMTVNPSLGVMVAGGLLVGLGTAIGNGCTSGHGVCGLSRLSVRSLVATCVFMAAAFLTVLVVRHGMGG
ncbi:MAG: YeeE/YedE thiosulfate transporter family protein [Pseudomonadota bacterium]